MLLAKKSQFTGMESFKMVINITMAFLMSRNVLFHRQQRFRYQFGADNSGTHFYHSHISTHMLDGQYGSLIIKDPPSENPFYNLYDEDKDVIFLSDWLHEFSVERFSWSL